MNGRKIRKNGILRMAIRTGAFFAVLCLLLFGTGIRVHAAPPLVTDEADVLSASQEQRLLQLLEEVGAQYDIDVAVYTVKTLGGRESLDVADDIYVYEEYGTGDDFSGILLLHCPDERDYAITCDGRVRETIPPAKLDRMLDDLISNMRSGADTGDYLPAYEQYARMVNENMEGSLPKILRAMGGNVFLAPVAGFITSFLYMGGQKRKLKNVARQRTAAAYVAGHGPQLQISRDMFVNRTLTRTPIRRESDSRSSSGGRAASVHTHSSGRTLSGGSRKY